MEQVYCEWLETYGSEKTRGVYCNAYAALRLRNSTPILDLSPEDVKLWRTWLLAERSSATTSVYLAGLSSFFTWAVSRGLVERNPVAGLGVQAVNRAPEYMTATEASAFLAAIDRSTEAGRRDYSLLLLMLLTGLRSREAREIRRGDVVSRPGGRLGLRYRAKGQQEAQLRILPQALGEALAAFLADRGPLADDAVLFVSRSPGRKATKPLTPWALSQIVEFYSIRALGRRINPHALRHAAAEILYSQTKDVRKVSELLGHKSLATTERYLKHLLDERAEAGDTIAAALGLSAG